MFFLFSGTIFAQYLIILTKSNKLNYLEVIMHTVEQTPPQIQAIFDFRNKIIEKTGRNISISEAIAGWIALGYAEQYRTENLNIID